MLEDVKALENKFIYLSKEIYSKTCKKPYFVGSLLRNNYKSFKIHQNGPINKP